MDALRMMLLNNSNNQTRLSQPPPTTNSLLSPNMMSANTALPSLARTSLMAPTISPPGATINALPAGLLLGQNGFLQQQQNALQQLLLAEAAQKLFGASLQPLPSPSVVDSLSNLNAQALLLNNPALLNAALLNTLLTNQLSSINHATLINESNDGPNSSSSSVPVAKAQEPKAHQPKREAPRASKKRARAHSDSDADDSLTEGASSHSSDELDGHHKRVHHDPELMQGERRLTIQFDSYGTRGEIPQTFGRGSCIIPDGLCGRHTLYGESWFFSVKHESYDKESGLACVTWSMKSLASNQNLARTETLAEARKRELHGRTIANQVVKKALEMRAQELEARLACEQNETWRLHLKGKIDALRPARFTQGPLAFGLHHKAVQDRMKELLSASEAASATSSE